MKLERLAGPESYALKYLHSIIAAQRELRRHRCEVCAHFVGYRLRRIDDRTSELIGSDPEVVHAALHSVIGQPAVDTFALIVDAHGAARGDAPADGSDRYRRYVLGRQHLPVFVVLTCSS